MQDAIIGCGACRFSKSLNGEHCSEPSLNTLRAALVWVAVAMFATACGGGGGITASSGNESNSGNTDVLQRPDSNPLANGTPTPLFNPQGTESQQQLSEPEASLRLALGRYNPIALLTWSLSSNHGLAPVVRYEYQVDSESPLDSSDPWLATSGARDSHVEDDLDDDLAYYFRVRAVLGDGTTIVSSEERQSPHPPSTANPQPDRPRNFQARGGNRRVLLTWSAPIPKTIPDEPESRESIQFYLYREANDIWRETDSETAHIIDGLEQNRTYTFQLRAVSQHGLGDIDSVSVSTTATTEMPGAPTKLAMDYDGTYTDLAWDAPLWDGGVAITSYEYRVGSGNWTSLTYYPISTNDCPYRCAYTGSIQGLNVGDSIQVRARNSVGVGAESGAVHVGYLPGLSVSDATANENSDTAIAFEITLDAATNNTVTVIYSTRGGTAHAVSDYENASGTLTFAPSETSKTVSVVLVQDSHDESQETFTLLLRNPANARIVRGEGTGTIDNTGPMPRAWLARFGRTAAEHVLEAVAGRIAEPRVSGLEGSLVGHQLRPDGDTGHEEGWRNHAERAAWVRKAGRGDDGVLGHGSYRPRGSELLAGSSFAFTGSTADGGFGSVWARGAYSDFDGRDGALSLDGEVRTAMLGADYAREDWLAGLVISRSRGKGGYRGAGAGAVESRLTGFYPYAAREISDRLSLWATAGYGEGDLTLTPEGQSPVETDMDLAMVAVGGRGQIVASEGYVLALKADGLLLRTTSDSVPGLASATANVNRLRLGLEGAWTVWLGDGSVLTPVLEVGLRHDGGDAETGFGADLGGGLVLEDLARGFSAELRARGLMTHEESKFEDWGISGSLRYDPGPSSDLGLSVSVMPAWGAASTGGANRLWNLRGAAPSLQTGSLSQDGRINAEIGYGLAVAGGRFIGTPSLRFEQLEGGQHYRFGYRLMPPRGGGLDLGLEVLRHQPGESGAEYRAGLTMTTPW